MVNSIKDIGIVFLPNQECKVFSLKMTSQTEQALPDYKKISSNPHITAIHIANLNEAAQESLQHLADSFFPQYANLCIDLPVTAIKATGGSMEEGFKWLDLQFETLESLKNLRQAIVDNFGPLHNGSLTRMYDDFNNFSDEQKEQIEKYGVTVHPHTPHITSWYIDLPNEEKTSKLQDIAHDLAGDSSLPSACYAIEVALVELGRNGNAIEIITTYPLCVEEEL